MVRSEFTIANEYRYNVASPLRWIVSHVRRYPWLPTLIVLSSIGATIAFSQTPLLVGQAFDLIASNKSVVDGLLWIAFAILGVRLLQGVLNLGNNVLVEMLAQRLERDARDELFHRGLSESG